MPEDEGHDTTTGDALDPADAHAGPAEFEPLPPTVAVAESVDRLDAVFIEDAMTRAGVPCTLVREVHDAGTRFVVRVHAQQEGAARAVIASIEGTPEPAGVKLAGGKSPMIALGLGLLPGMGHHYAGLAGRRNLLLASFLAAAYWARYEILVAIAPLLLALLDGFGARAHLLGRRTPMLTSLIWTAPLWVSLPGALALHAPTVYVGGGGRDVCARLRACDVDWPPGDCEAELAAGIRYQPLLRMDVARCATYLEARGCDAALGPPSLDGCWQSPFCADNQSEGEAACVRAFFAGPEAYTPWVDSRPRGWGM